MSLLDELLADIAIKQYLKDFPKSEWTGVVKKTLLYGIHSLTALQSVGLTSPRMGNQNLHIQLGKIPNLNYNKLEDQIVNSNQNRSNSQPNHKKHEKTRLDQSPEEVSNRDHHRCKKSIKHKPKSSKPHERSARKDKKDLVQPPFKLTGRERQESKRQIPKHLLNIDSKIKNEIQNYRLSVPKYTDRSVLEEPDYKENVQTQLYTENRHSNMHQTVKRDDSVWQKPHEKQRSDRSFIREEENFEIQKTKKDCRLFIKANEQYQPEFHKQVPQSTKNRISSDEKMRWEDWGTPFQTADFSREISSFTQNDLGYHHKKYEIDAKSPSSCSSFSTYHAPDEIKTFYQNEFKNLLPEEVPRRLNPVELPLRQDIYRISSYSVQPISCSSEDDDKSLR